LSVPLEALFSDSQTEGLLRDLTARRKGSVRN